MLFEARVDSDGKIAIPHSVIEDLGERRKAALVVQLTERRYARELDRRGISEEEIARISNAQRESRESVIRFLLSEGVLVRRGRRRLKSRRRAR